MIIDLGPLTIKLDVLIIQIVNVLILFWIFKSLFGSTLIEEIAKRRALTDKLRQAEEEYDRLLDQAEAEKNRIIEEALAHKKHLILEAQDFSKKEREKLIRKAEDDAARIIQKAQEDADLKQRDLDSHFVQGVKNTSLALIEKMFASKKDLQKNYLEGLIEEFSHSYKNK
jgi:F0F1-type ATP synthase membrane subunit b/b'